MVLFGPRIHPPLPYLGLEYIHTIVQSKEPCIRSDINVLEHIKLIGYGHRFSTEKVNNKDCGTGLHGRECRPKGWSDFTHH
jgi:hypothetical protein